MPELAARRDRLGALFGAELADRTRTLNTLILQLEQGSGVMPLGPIGRELHSLKGAAQAVGASGVEQVSHAAESAVVAVTLRGGHRPDQAWFDAMYAAFDFLDNLSSAPGADTSQVISALVAVTPEGHPEVRAPIVTLHPRALPDGEADNQPRRERIEQNTVRVALVKLDTLLTESGELSVTHLRIAQRANDLRELQHQMERWQREWTRTRPARARMRRANNPSLARDDNAFLRFAERSDQEILSIVQRTRELVSDLAHNTAQLATVSNAISEEVMAIRLMPAGTIFLPLERLVRDLSRQTGKDARLVLEGSDVEIDRRILDELRDPLLHMVRNTIDHGMEVSEERVLAGKSAQGTLRLSAVQRGDRVQITVEDDGRGLDVDAIRETAVRRNLLSAERAEGMDTTALIDLIFSPGFSTRAEVSELSGRGVGMDVVREHVTRLGGDISVRTTPGSGTSFSITVPLTLATTRVLLVENGGHTYAIPSSSIERTGRMRDTDVQRLEGRLAIQIDGRAVPVVELSEVLQQRAIDTRPVAAEQDWRPFFVLPHGDRAVALLADRLVDETELVVKALGAPLTRVRHVGGAAVLGTGAVVVILNPGDLVKSALGSIESAPRSAPLHVAVAHTDNPRRRVLVVDDSVMTRTLERTIFESAGYSVVVASDGMHALEILSDGAHVDAVVSDIEMPRMNGLELTAALRQDERWRNLPIVLVTSMGSPEHIEAGAAAGADAYIVKGRFDQNDLLQTVGRLL